MTKNKYNSQSQANYFNGQKIIQQNSAHPKMPIAVGVGYDGTKPPTVTISGRQDLAKKMRSLARRMGIPIRREPVLAARLVELSQDEEIPQSLYEPVAELLVELEEDE